ncbi:MAG TPA: ECF-type sigma factor [Rhodanobacteraceae bacterium]|nr:ECF-type sigma factor [Rhodanobacteraceae bacterium]
MSEPRATPREAEPPRLAPDALFEQVYQRLKALAHRQLKPAQRSVTLETTSVVHELYLRMSGQDGLAFDHPSQFFVYAARAMRHLLSDHAREHLARRAGGDWIRITLTGSDEDLALANAEQALELDAALSRLEAVDDRAARVVELRYFAGLTVEQSAEALGVSRRTIDRDWDFAHAFLKTETK